MFCSGINTSLSYFSQSEQFKERITRKVLRSAVTLTVFKVDSPTRAARRADWTQPTLTLSLWLFCSILISSFSLSHSPFSSSSRWHAPWASCRAPSSSASSRCSFRSDRASRLRELWRVKAGQSSTGKKKKRAKTWNQRHKTVCFSFDFNQQLSYNRWAFKSRNHSLLPRAASLSVYLGDALCVGMWVIQPCSVLEPEYTLTVSSFISRLLPPPLQYTHVQSQVHPYYPQSALKDVFSPSFTQLLIKNTLRE